jgi:integrase
MKGGREHRVPLAREALALIERQRSHTADPRVVAWGQAPGSRPPVPCQGQASPGRSGAGLVFPGRNSGRPLSEQALLRLLQRLGYGKITVHGFRSAFTDWCSEETAASAETRQLALAHRISDQVEAAYRRGDQFAKRRGLAQAWADFCYSGLGIDHVAGSATSGRTDHSETAGSFAVP